MSEFIFVKDLVLRKDEIISIQKLESRVSFVLRSGVKWTTPNERERGISTFEDIVWQLQVKDGGVNEFQE